MKSGVAAKTAACVTLEGPSENYGSPEYAKIIKSLRTDRCVEISVKRFQLFWYQASKVTKRLNANLTKNIIYIYEMR